MVFHSEKRTTITTKERTKSVREAVAKMVKSERNGDLSSNINWERLDNILGRVKIKVTRIACLEDPWT